MLPSLRHENEPVGVSMPFFGDQLRRYATPVELSTPGVRLQVAGRCAATSFMDASAGAADMKPTSVLGQFQIKDVRSRTVFACSRVDIRC